MTDHRKLLHDGLAYEKGGALDRALDCYRQAALAATEPRMIAEALCRQASAHRVRCEWDAALHCARRSAAIAREIGSRSLLADALNAEGAVYLLRGEFAAATPLLEQMLAMAETTRQRGVALQNLGSAAAQQGDLAAAERRFLEASECFRADGYVWGEAHVLNNTAAVALDRGDAAMAERVAKQATVAALQVGDLDLVGVAMVNHAEALARLGRLAEAADLASTAMGNFVTTGNDLRRVECLRLLGDIHCELGATEIAMRCYREGLRLAELVGTTLEVTEITHCLSALEERQAGGADAAAI